MKKSEAGQPSEPSTRNGVLQRTCNDIRQLHCVMPATRLREEWRELTTTSSPSPQKRGRAERRTWLLPENSLPNPSDGAKASALRGRAVRATKSFCRGTIRGVEAMVLARALPNGPDRDHTPW